MALALGAAPIAANAQTHGAAAGTPGTTSAAPQESSAGKLNETQWLRQRVEQLQTALARGDNCAVKPGTDQKTGAAAAGMKSGQKAGKAGSGMGPMGMEPMGDKMGAGMKPSPSGKPADKMDPGPMQPPSDPPAMPAGGMKDE
jgi:hypothetical protein